VRPDAGPGIFPPFGWPLDRNGCFRGRVAGDRTTVLFLESDLLVADPVRVAGPGHVVIAAREGAIAVLRLQLPAPGEHEQKNQYSQAPTVLLSRRGEAPVRRFPAFDSKTGTATFGGVQPGLYDELRLHVVPYPWVRLKDVRLRDGRNELGEVAIPRGSRVFVRVRSPEGQAPPRLCVGASSLESPETPGPFTNPEASEIVVLGGLGAGRWRVSVRLMQAEFLGFDRELDVDGETDLEVELDLRK
jgi:hypothetical protein